jgi:uncharacterized protein (TIGR02453 family)
VSAFDGFPPDAWRFLDVLAEDNTAGCFDRHREMHQSAIAVPSHALVEALVPRLASEVHPALTGEAKVGRSLFRINRDIRFAADKTPYKTYVDFLFWAGDGDPRSSAACIIRLTSTTVLTGAGRIGVRGTDLAAYRAHVTDPDLGPQLRVVVDRVIASGATISDAVRAKPPRPHAADAMNADLLCRDGFHLSRVEPHPPVIAGPALVDWLVDRLRPYGELIELLR